MAIFSQKTNFKLLNMPVLTFFKVNFKKNLPQSSTQVTHHQTGKFNKLVSLKVDFTAGTDPIRFFASNWKLENMEGIVFFNFAQPVNR